MKIELRGDSIRDVMTPEPVTVAATTTLEQAARHMRDAGIGNVIVLEGELITGILTDRDIVLEVVAKEYGGRLKIAKINVDENQTTPAKFGIRGIPTLMLFKNGNVEATKVGALSKTQLNAFIDSNI